jgi:AcrR family transcriptional regulator
MTGQPRGASETAGTAPAGGSDTEGSHAGTAFAGGVSVDELPAWQLARRRRIIQAALEALETQEYERIQIRDVAASADVALGTLYRYFSSKEHLYAAVLQEWAAFERPRTPRASKLPSSDRVRRRVHSVVRALQKQPQYYKVHVLLQASSDDNARELIARFEKTAWSSLAAEFDVLAPDDAMDAAVMIWSIINSMVTQVIYRDGDMSQVLRIVDRFLDLVLRDIE